MHYIANRKDSMGYNGSYMGYSYNYNKSYDDNYDDPRNAHAHAHDCDPVHNLKKHKA